LLILTQAGRLAGKAEDEPAPERHLAPPNRATIVLGLCCFAAFMTEGAATDWSTIYLRFSRNMPIDSAALGYAAYAVAMAVSRLFGDAVATKLGQPWLLRLGCALGVLGFALVIFMANGWVDILGFGLIGLGTGNIAPLVFSAAARVPGMAASHAVPAVVGLGYAGFLAGPVLIGLLANHLGLGFALGVIGAMLAGTFFAARSVA
jgi:MFS family permease